MLEKVNSEKDKYSCKMEVLREILANAEKSLDNGDGVDGCDFMKDLMAIE